MKHYSTRYSMPIKIRNVNSKANLCMSRIQFNLYQKLRILTSIQVVYLKLCSQFQNLRVKKRFNKMDIGFEKKPNK